MKIVRCKLLQFLALRCRHVYKREEMKLKMKRKKNRERKREREELNNIPLPQWTKNSAIRVERSVAVLFHSKESKPSQCDTLTIPE